MHTPLDFLPGKFRLRSGHVPSYPANSARHCNLAVTEAVIAPPRRWGIILFLSVPCIGVLILCPLLVLSTKDYSTGTHCLLDPTRVLFAE